MSYFGESLRKIRIDRGMSQDALASLLGTSKQVISRYENNQRSPKVSVVADYADKLGVSISYLTGDSSDDLNHVPRSNLIPISELHFQRVPVIGSVAAGEPIHAPEELGVYVSSPVDCDAAITVQGDSMAPTYQDGDLVYIKCTPDVPDATVAVVFLDDEATLKRVYKQPGGLMLISENTAHPPIMVSFDDYAVVRVFGVPVGFTRIYRSKGNRKGKK